MLLAELVATSKAVASTPARSAKVTSLATLLQRLGPTEVEAAVCFLVGRPRQGRIGIGWATLEAVDPPPAAAPSIEVLALDYDRGTASPSYTDGLTEAPGRDGEFGARRLGLLVASCAGLSADATAGRLKDEILAYQGGTSRDDLAVLVLRRQARPARLNHPG